MTLHAPTKQVLLTMRRWLHTLEAIFCGLWIWSDTTHLAHGYSLKMSSVYLNKTPLNRIGFMDCEHAYFLLKQVFLVCRSIIFHRTPRMMI